MNIKIIDWIKSAISKADAAQATADAALPKSGGTMTGDIYDKNSSLAFLPVGSVFAFAANSTPAGCLLCNGAAVSRTTYAALFEAIGTTYGEGDGSTTFNLPNLTDMFIQGSGTAGTVKSAGLPNITGNIAPNRCSYYGEAYSEGAFYHQAYTNTVGSSQEGDQGILINFDASRCSTIYGNSVTVQPPALTMRYYIKY